METIIKNVALVLALLAAPGLAPAAEASPSEKSPPSMSAQGSAFNGYRPLTDEPMRLWREANDEVARLRGHVGHIGSEAGTPDSPGTVGAGTALRPGTGNADKVPPGGHTGHHR